MPHLGGTFFAMKDRVLASFGFHGGKLVDFESRLDHFYFDTAPPFWGKAAVDCAIATLGPQRILFGTDHPLGSNFLIRGVDMVEGWQLGATTRQAVLCDNARNFWKVR